jgi:hypothetical protein
MVPVPPLGTPTEVRQLVALFVRNVAEMRAAWAYGPEHEPNFAVTDNVCDCESASERPGLTSTLPPCPEQLARLLAVGPVTTTGPIVFGGLSPRTLIAVMPQVYVLPTVSLLATIGLANWSGLLGAPPSVDVHRAR